MLVAGDTLLAISNSGKIAELRPILAHATTLGCKVICIASPLDILVMRRTDVRLLLPKARERLSGPNCPDNINHYASPRRHS